MLKQIKVLGIALVLGLGLNMVGCDDVEEVEIQDTNPQVEEKIDKLTEEQKIDLLKNVAKKQAINIMEEKGIDCLGLENAFNIMLAALNDKTTTEAMGLDIETIKLATAEGMLEVANYNDGTMPEDIVRMCDYIVANNVKPKNEEEYYMLMNGETWEDVIAYREELKAAERAEIEQFEKEYNRVTDNCILCGKMTMLNADTMLCDQCKNYAQCYDCGEYKLMDYMVFDGNKYHCGCAEEALVQCDRCGEEVDINDTVYYGEGERYCYPCNEEQLKEEGLYIDFGN